MSSDESIPEKPRRSTRKKQMVDKSKKNEMLDVSAILKKPKLMQLAQTKLTRAKALLANTNANSSSAKLPLSNCNGTERKKSLDNKVMVMLLRLKEKITEDRIYANAKFRNR